jgi:hypothetical protein
MSDSGSGFRRVDEQLVHQGHIWHVVQAEFESPVGERFRRDIVRSPGAVAAVPPAACAYAAGTAENSASANRGAANRKRMGIPAYC